ncbi:MAG: type II toxin-antitoxin system PemK/MazF family toxin [Nitrososphaerales archaeon]
MHSASQRDIVLVPYPFSDLSQAKYRPAIVMSNDVYNRKFKDFIAIPLTTNPNTRDHTVPVTSREMETGSLTVASVAKVDKIFSLEQKLVVRTYGRLRQDIFNKIRSELLGILT